MSVYAPAQKPVLQPGVTAPTTTFIKRHPVLSYYALAFAISGPRHALVAGAILQTSRVQCSGRLDLPVVRAGGEDRGPRALLTLAIDDTTRNDETHIFPFRALIRPSAGLLRRGATSRS